MERFSPKEKMLEWGFKGYIRVYHRKLKILRLENVKQKEQNASYLS